MGHSNIPEKEAYVIEIDSRYSTTRRVSKQQPILTNNQESMVQSSLFPLPENVEMIDGGLRRLGYVKDSFPDLPLITVITIVYNGDKHLEQTIQSVISQTYNNVEYIVIDGGSTDLTLDIIRQYNSVIDYWISEADKGIADAMNKGNARATGDFVIYLHADDYFTNVHSLEKAVRYIKDSDGFVTCEILSCEILYGKSLKRMTPRGFNFWMHFKTGVYHQGVLCNRALLENMGGFDTQFKIAMDFDFFLRAYNSGVKIKYAPIVLSVMRDTGISSRTNWKGLTERFIEEYRVHEKNTKSMPIVYYRLYWILYAPFRIIKYLIASLASIIKELIM
jgi:glycosyltransferase involved in cell wall biosynthesis